jgi:hypothetical protein
MAVYMHRERRSRAPWIAGLMLALAAAGASGYWYLFAF